MCQVRLSRESVVSVNNCPRVAKKGPPRSPGASKPVVSRLPIGIFRLSLDIPATSQASSFGSEPGTFFRTLGYYSPERSRLAVAVPNPPLHSHRPARAVARHFMTVDEDSVPSPPVNHGAPGPASGCKTSGSSQVTPLHHGISGTEDISRDRRSRLKMRITLTPRRVGPFGAEFSSATVHGLMTLSAHALARLCPEA